MLGTKKTTIISVLFLAILALLPGCAKQTKQQKRSPEPITLESLWDGTESTVTKDGVTIKAKKFTADDFDVVFDGRGKKMLGSTKGSRAKRGIQPILMSVKNESTSTWTMTKNSVGMKLIESDKRLRSYFFTYNTGWMVLMCLIGGATLYIGASLILIYTPILFTSAAGTIFCLSILGAAGIVLVSTPIVGVYQFKKDKAANEEVSCSVQQKQLKDAIVLAPGQSIDALVFVEKKNLKDQFDVTLFDADNVQNELRVMVDLNKKA